MAEKPKCRVGVYTAKYGVCLKSAHSHNVVAFKKTQFFLLYASLCPHIPVTINTVKTCILKMPGNKFPGVDKIQSVAA